MSKKFAVIIVFMVLFVGIFHFMFIMFDYAFHNPDSGAFVKLREVANETITNDTFRQSVDDNQNMLRDMFGYGRFILLAVTVIVCVIAITQKPSNVG